MKLQVSGFSYHTTEAELRGLFAEHGTISIVTVSRDHTGASRGSALVEMPDDNEARHAIQAVSGHQVDGRLLRVVQARL